MGQAALTPRMMLDRFAVEFHTSRKLYDQAGGLFPSGVTHDLRYLEPFPVYIERALGARKWDVDGHELVDFWSGHGSLLLGHSHPEVVEAVQRQMGRSTHPGGCHELEIEWGQWVKKLVPSAEKMRFTSSGTEATLMALRVARIHTGKPRVLKFAGHFHGWHDFLMPACDLPYSGAETPGIPREYEPIIIPPNKPELVEQALKAHPEIGAIILEPTGGHFGQVPVRGDFLKTLRELASKHGKVLIFDEVISGFRVHPGGAQGLYGVTPDLTTMAKILAGGLPGGCLAGRADILDHIAFRPDRPKMKHPGTFNANPLSAAAGSTTLRIVATGEPCQQANAMGKELRAKLNALCAERQLDWICYGEFSGFKLLPGYDGPRPTGDAFIPYDGDPARLEPGTPRPLVHAFRCGMLLNGVDLPGLGGMTTAAHEPADIDKMVAAVSGTLDLLRDEGMLNGKQAS